MERENGILLHPEAEVITRDIGITELRVLRHDTTISSSLGEE